MQVNFITSGEKYKRQSVSKKSYRAFLEDDEITIMRTEDNIKHSHTNIQEGKTRLRCGEKEWLILSFYYPQKRPRYLIAKVKEVI